MQTLKNRNQITANGTLFLEMADVTNSAEFRINMGQILIRLVIVCNLRLLSAKSYDKIIRLNSMTESYAGKQQGTHKPISTPVIVR